MKKLSVYLLLISLLLSFDALKVFPMSSTSDDAIHNAKAEYSPDGAVLTVECETDSPEILYLFSSSALSENGQIISNPISEAKPSDKKIKFKISCNAYDPSVPVCGYFIASKSQDEYSAITDIIYPDNFSDFAKHCSDYPVFLSKKGLQVQLITDAQRLGVKHTVVTAFINDLITDSTNQNAVQMVFGNSKYYFDRDALASLDYRIKTLSYAGIHIYLNILLGGGEDDSLYISQDAFNTEFFAPNISTDYQKNRFAALLYFLADRYSEPNSKYGFCGSFIIGYEVNNEDKYNYAGIFDDDTYARYYADLIRISDIAVRSAYKNARVFVSLSNNWNSDIPMIFGGKDFLQKICEYDHNVPFGVAVNPYPSENGIINFTSDKNATLSDDTEYLTMNNIGLLTDFLKADNMMYGSSPRSVVISEFGLTGTAGTQSEKEQAAYFAYAYTIANKNDLIESFIWHRHVDHSGEQNMNFGLFSSGSSLLQPSAPKLIHKVFCHIDDSFDTDIIADTVKILPEKISEEIVSERNIRQCRVSVEVQASNSDFQSSKWLSVTQFDFSKSLYGFYPSDNAEYLEQCENDQELFMRAGLVNISNYEYGGVGTYIGDCSELITSSAISVKLRVYSEQNNVPVMLLLTSSDGKTVVSFPANIPTSKWCDISFDLPKEIAEMKDGCSFKIWAGASNPVSNSYLDISSVNLYHENESHSVKTVLIISAVIAGVIVIFNAAVLIIRKKHRS